MYSQRNLPKLPAYLEHTLYADLLKEQARNSQAGSIDGLDLRLPSQWNPNDKSRNVEVSSSGLELLYTGPGSKEEHAGLVRSDYPIRPQCGIYYYEMKVLSKGEDGFIGIGFCGARNGLNRLPGWDSDSWGYHGDDGHSFQERGQGNKYGPQFTTGDVVGCGIDLINRTAFFSKNGIYLGPAFASIKTKIELYPCVGLRTAGELVAVNFGQEPFVFDIVQYVKEQKIKVMAQVARQSPPMTNSVVDRLVMSYLVYQGYMKTAKAIIKDTCHVSGEKLQLSHSDYNALQPRQEKLKSFTKSSSRSDLKSSKSNGHGVVYSSMSSDEDAEEANSRKQSMVGFMDSGLVLSDDDMVESTMESIMAYGRTLRNEYYNDKRSEVQQKLQDIFSLFAYSDPRNSPMSHLLSDAAREELVDKLNAVILGTNEFFGYTFQRALIFAFNSATEKA
ncbi:concanavalin A-like lectin/glucanase domain-containing protein [Dichotomocladium elegans]|nr:concanavalin A-like lectin/glucanase domain-containing protein [Dichotomocladium elegans]